MAESRGIEGLKRIGIVLLLLVLLPALFYSAYEISSLSDTEELIAGTYRQQLDAILFSVNQYAWDVVSGWANSISGDSRKVNADRLTAILQMNKALMGVVFTDSSLKTLHILPSLATLESLDIDEARLKDIMRADAGKIEQLIRLQRSGYRRIEPLILQRAPSTANSALMLLFVSNADSDDLTIAGMMVHPQGFLRNVLGQKLIEAAGEDFVLTVVRDSESNPVFSSAPGTRLSGDQRKALWILPGYSLTIQMKGTTIEEIAQSRFYRNLTLIIILDIVLLIGAWFVYRTLRKEMELIRLKSDFVSNVSHELRTPLALIRMFAETLEMNRVPTEVKKQEYYATILQEAERLTRLVNNILNFSRMEAGRKPYDLQPADLNTLVQKILTTYHPHLVRHGFSLTTDLHPALPEIAADGEAIAESLINILDNAMKYSADDKRIRVRTGCTNGLVFVEIEDHGIGIAHVDQKKIFEKFYRVSSALVHNTKGSGLGLTLVKHIVEAHRGSVAVQSEPGKGSAFRLSFPAMNTQQPPSHIS